MKRRILCVLIMLIVLSVPLVSHAREKLVVFWSFSPDELSAPHIAQLIENFKKKHDVDIEFVDHRAKSTDELHENYLRFLSAKNGIPDVIQIDVNRIPEFASMNYLVDLTNAFSPSEKARFDKTFLEEAMWKGRMWVAPMFNTFGLILYRRDLIEKPPVTWDELIDRASRFVAQGRYGYMGQMAKREGLTCNLLEFFWSNGGDPKFEGDGSFFSQKDVEGLQMLVDIVNKYKLTPPDQLSSKEHEAFQFLKDDKVLFIRHWPDIMFKLKDFGPAYEARYGMMQIPRGPSGTKGYAVHGGWLLGVNRYSKNSKIAIELVRLFVGDEYQKYLLMELEKLPSIKSIYYDSEALAKYPWIKDVPEFLADSRARPRTPYYPELSKILLEEAHLALERKITPREALDRAEKKMRAFLKSAGK